ncbi:uncharacterized protein (DUF111 family) [Amycolatopsis thermophila]|uniref:Uncharacterized protein (DUF111 family) n=1 Tax=Amycolatopsis thermophila TaxID=206084 RepID=A0ABU0F0F5_9PSEU|nr:uncharacterized protein (DUF111 family) [Amycolatopsis thermophila]
MRDDAVRVFARLAEAEAGVHGTSVDAVHFHEVAVLDAIADVVGYCAALNHLGVERIVASPVAVGSGTVRPAHGEMPVPVPAVLPMARGWRVRAGGDGELATPTGMALVTELAAECGPLPAMRVETSGCGAGTKDFPGRVNVVRVAIGSAGEADATDEVVLEADVDDLDPRVWPGVLLSRGAADAWLTPTLMKKGRPTPCPCWCPPLGWTRSRRSC